MQIYLSSFFSLFSKFYKKNVIDNAYHKMYSEKKKKEKQLGIQFQFILRCWIVRQSILKFYM